MKLDEKIITDVNYLFESPNGVKVLGGGETMREIIDSLREQGMSDAEIEGHISISTDTGYMPISEITGIRKNRNGFRRDDILGTHKP